MTNWVKISQLHHYPYRHRWQSVYKRGGGWKLYHSTYQPSDQPTYTNCAFSFLSYINFHIRLTLYFCRHKTTATHQKDTRVTHAHTHTEKDSSTFSPTVTDTQRQEHLSILIFIYIIMALSYKANHQCCK